MQYNYLQMLPTEQICLNTRKTGENDGGLASWKQDGSVVGRDEGGSTLPPSGQSLKYSRNSKYGQRLGSAGGMLATPI